VRFEVCRVMYVAGLVQIVIKVLKLDLTLLCSFVQKKKFHTYFSSLNWF